MARYDEGIAKYIPGLLELKFQGMLKTLILGTNLPSHPTLTWENWTFKFCWLIIIILTLTVSIYVPIKI